MYFQNTEITFVLFQIISRSDWWISFAGEIKTNYTGIDNPLPESESGEGGVYDIYGRRVVRVVSPGLYIVNGKKTYLRPWKRLNLSPVMDKYCFW